MRVDLARRPFAVRDPHNGIVGYSMNKLIILASLVFMTVPLGCMPPRIKPLNNQDVASADGVQPDGNEPGDVSGVSAPKSKILNGPSALTSETTARFEFECDQAGCTFVCKIDNGDWAACTSPVVYSDLSNGQHVFELRAKGATGIEESSSSSHLWTVDPTALFTVITNKPALVTKENSATIAFECNQQPCTYLCTLDDQAQATCTSPFVVSGLPDGDHKFSVVAKNSSGVSQTVASSYAWRIDTTAPNVLVLAKPSSASNQTAVKIEFKCSETACSFECNVDDAGWQECASPLQLASLADGSHSVKVRAKDLAGNTGLDDVSIEWVTDTKAPSAVLTATPKTATNDHSATFEFKCDEGQCTFQCRIDETDWVDCTSALSYSDLDDGAHKLEIKALDASGNEQGIPSEFNWTIDSTKPTTNLDVTPPAETPKQTATFQFSCTKPPCSFQCSLDGAQWSGCQTPLNLTNLDFGAHTLEVKATDQFGNEQSPATKWTWNVNGWIFVGVGLEFTCGAKSDGTVLCWGNTSFLGTEKQGDITPTPSKTAFSATWKQLAVGGLHVCGIKSDDTLWCWGKSLLGELGIGDSDEFGGSWDEPVQEATKAKWRWVSARYQNTCGVRSDGLALCWGDNSNAQVDFAEFGDGAFSDVPVLMPTSYNGEWDRVWTFGGLNCGIKNKKSLHCWPYFNQQGLPTVNQIEQDLDWSVVSDGGPCGIRQNKSLWCWVEKDGYRIPKQVGSDAWIAVSGSPQGSICGIKADNTAWCWGANGLGELGLGYDSQVEIEPKPVKGTAEGLRARQIAAGMDHTCMITLDNVVLCWGSNSLGQLGRGVGPDLLPHSNEPLPVVE